MAVNRLALARVNFCQLAFGAKKTPGKFINSATPAMRSSSNHQLQIVRRELRARRFQMRRRNATRQHDEKIHGEIFARIPNVADAVEAEDVGVFVRVNHHRARAVRHDRAREFRRGEHRAFDVKMPVNQARREIRALEINHLLRLVIAKADDASVFDRDVRLVDFAAEDVDHPGVFEKQFRRLFAARDAQFVLQLPHFRTCSAIACFRVLLPSGELTVHLAG